MMKPAINGPIILAPLKAAEFKAMALVISALDTTSARNACRAGISKALIVPKTRAVIATCQMVIISISVRRAMIIAGNIDKICVRIRIFLFGYLSATIPPKG